MNSAGLIYDGGTLFVFENLDSDSGYNNRIYLLKTASLAGEFLFVDDAGGQKSFSQSALAGYGIDQGDQLLFFIKADDYLLPPVFQLVSANNQPDRLMVPDRFRRQDHRV